EDTKSVVVATGGDDNAVSCLVLTFDSNWERIVERRVGRVEGAHASTVTGTRLINPTHFLTTSVDQRLKVWRLLPSPFSPSSSSPSSSTSAPNTNTDITTPHRVAGALAKSAKKPYFVAVGGDSGVVEVEGEVDLKVVREGYVGVADVSDLDV
ncbi:hypothetical protein HK102_010452, partial [Quaeritorhiza haematococci]